MDYQVYLSYPNINLTKKLNVNLFFIPLTSAFSFLTYVAADITLDRKLGFRSNKVSEFGCKTKNIFKVK